ncbi:hypothetical protein GCM10009838_50890 [Catenulispora subtropica]|uniref:AraC family transcriptional regulator n=1 Tax=Catenulispora subtropica TaxID=450798 RepID=A0ABN2SA65_9ACTN
MGGADVSRPLLALPGRRGLDPDEIYEHGLHALVARMRVSLEGAGSSLRRDRLTGFQLLTCFSRAFHMFDSPLLAPRPRVRIADL